ncbi:MAG: YraN family protein [Polyangiales bacterium]
MPLASGEAAEREAERALVARGWRILDRRLRVGRLEIDLLARRDDIIAVVEVRGRRQGGWVDALDTLDPRKRAKIAAASRVLWSRRFANDPTVRVLRVDFIAVTWRATEAPLVEIAEGVIDVNNA